VQTSASESHLVPVITVPCNAWRSACSDNTSHSRVEIVLYSAVDCISV